MALTIHQEDGFLVAIGHAQALCGESLAATSGLQLRKMFNTKARVRQRLAWVTCHRQDTTTCSARAQACPATSHFVVRIPCKVLHITCCNYSPVQNNNFLVQSLPMQAFASTQAKQTETTPAFACRGHLRAIPLCRFVE
eukprot:TRINITY_DN80708_c0_g1_i1.p1 TRINITY_DN80708_c0_g1~~TRINITY_DN80708_c0_g1_i1.p1  ORF type:complete len:161 (+),score=2.43 TRINITY_DN80708_c0_g1_i1:69-485(+)